MAEIEDFFKFAFSVDNVIFGFDQTDLKVILIRRGAEPFKDKWALPGDLVYPDEDLAVGATRILEELVDLRDVYLEQVGAFGGVNRHPFGRVITVAYYSLIKIREEALHASSWAEQARWHTVQDALGMDLAFDHKEILEACFDRLRRMVKSQPVGFELLPEAFTLTELQQLYETILGVPLDKRNFRKKILAMNILIDLNRSQAGVAHRPARLYKFDHLRYNAVIQDGFTFQI